MTNSNLWKIQLLLLLASLLFIPMAQAQVPPNDDCASPIAIAVPSNTLGTTTGATTDSGSPTCGPVITSPGVWYTVTGNGNTYTASTCNPGTTFDTKLSVYCEDCAALTCVSGNDDGGSGDPSLCSETTFCTEPEAQYRVLVHGFGGSSGGFELSMADDGTACSGAVSCLARQIINSTPIPTVGQFGLLALLLMLTGAGLYRLRRG